MHVLNLQYKMSTVPINESSLKKIYCVQYEKIKQTDEIKILYIK